MPGTRVGRGAAVGSPPPHPWRLHACRSWCKEPEVSRRVSPSPSHPHPHLQAPTAGLARIHAAGWPSPQAGLPGLAQLWPWGGSGRPPGQGQAAGWAAAQLFRGAGGSLRGGGLSLPAYVVTPAPWYQGPPLPHAPGSPGASCGYGDTAPGTLVGSASGKNCGTGARPLGGHQPCGRVVPYSSPAVLSLQGGRAMPGCARPPPCTSSEANAVTAPEIKTQKSLCFG